MSGSAALEYGFPSTHSANAVSVAVYAILLLHSPSNTFSPTTTVALEALAYFYAVSIVFGRLYCGMHGFLDVIIGSLMGAAISLVEIYFAPRLESWLFSNDYWAPLTVALIIIALVRVHPEPADDCPCFDDSVAFAGVMIGLECGTWRFARYSSLAPIYSGPNATFDLSALGWVRAIARLVVGVAVIFAWREIMKPTLLSVLPHLYRFFETHGISLPRRFFVRASEYKDVPLHQRDDNVLPAVSDIPKLVRSFRGPGRGRSVSIGPQSAADAYETLAYRERRRRESRGSDAGSPAGIKGRPSLGSLREKAAMDGVEVCLSQASGVQGNGKLAAEFENTTLVESPTTSPDAADTYLSVDGDELGEKEVFSRVVKPRVRYDVEVVTKLVVYTGWCFLDPRLLSSWFMCASADAGSTGIAWLAVDFIPTGFEKIGLGAAHLASR